MYSACCGRMSNGELRLGIRMASWNTLIIVCRLFHKDYDVSLDYGYIHLNLHEEMLNKGAYVDFSSNKQ